MIKKRIQVSGVWYALSVLFLAVFFVFSADADGGHGVISEVQFSGGTGKSSEDFIELHNPGEKAISLDGWRLKKRKKTGTEESMIEFGEDDIIPAGGYYLWSSNSLAERLDPDSSNSNMLASDNSIALLDDDGNVIDAVAWGTGLVDPFVEEECFLVSGNFFERKKNDDGIYVDTDNNGEDFMENDSTSPQAGHCAADPGDEKCSLMGGDSDGDEEESDDLTYEHSIRLNEMLPYPSKDSGIDEYIELFNPSDDEVDLSGWILKDGTASGRHVFSKDSLIESGSFFVVHGSEYGFALNNTTKESVFLIDPAGEVVSTATYEKSRADISYSFDGERWRWSKSLTPGKKNIVGKITDFEIKMDAHVYKGIPSNFEIISEKDDLDVTWDFGDERQSYKQEAQHTYTKEKKFQGSVIVFDGSEETEKKFSVDVEEFPKPKMKIVKVNPNPPGIDSDSESITISNESHKKVNLQGWSIASGASSEHLTNHPITEDLEIKPGKRKEITREFSKFTLPNEKAKIELRYPNGKIAHSIKYLSDKNMKEGMAYVKIKDVWQWIMENPIPVVENEKETLPLEREQIRENIPGEDADVQTLEGMLKKMRDELADMEVETVAMIELGDQLDSGQFANIADEDVGKQSEISNQHPLLINAVIVTEIEQNIVDAAIHAPATVRDDGNQYRFVHDSSQRSHYAIIFARKALANMNMLIGSVIEK